MISTIRRGFYFFAILLVLLLSACSGSTPDAYDSQQQPIRLQNYLGKWVIINYWATWCAPCLTEMPILEKMAQQYHKKIVVLGVSFDGLTDAKLNQIAKKYALTYPLLSHFPLHKLGITKVNVLPVSYLINPQGKLVKTLQGPQTQEQFLQVIQ